MIGRVVILPGAVLLAGPALADPSELLAHSELPTSALAMQADDALFGAVPAAVSALPMPPGGNTEAGTGDAGLTQVAP